MQAVAAVFRSWNSPRALTYRELEGIANDLGTAVTVQAMVFGNLDETSGTGVAFTRDPNTGEPGIYGDFLFRAQGEDVVSGRYETLPIGALQERLPEPYDELVRACGLLERHFADMADLEFTVESGKLYMLQARRGKRAAVAAVCIAVDLAEEGLIDRAEAVRRISVKHLTRLDRPHIDPRATYRLLTTGLNASPGLATGRVCFDPDEVLAMSEEGPVILVRVETSPSDVHGMALSAGILTSTGGLVSHAALVARDMGVPAVVGAKDLEIDMGQRCLSVDGIVVEEGAVITIDGTTGEVVEGAVSSVVPGQSQHVETLLAWADEIAGAASPGASPVARLQTAHRALAASEAPTP